MFGEKLTFSGGLSRETPYIRTALKNAVSGSTGLGPNATPEQMVSFCRLAAQAFEATYFQKTQAMGNMLVRSDKLTARLTKDTKLRTAWAGYVARANLYCCNDLFASSTPMLDAVDEGFIGTALSGYDREKELHQKMVVGLTGNLDIDLKTNFVARKAARVHLQNFLNIMNWLYGYAGFVMELNLSYGFIGAAFLPRVETTEDGLGAFFDEICQVGNGAKDFMTQPRQECILAIKADVDSWIKAVTLPASIVAPDGTKTSSILPGTASFCTEAVVQDWNQFAVQFDHILGDRNRMPIESGGTVLSLSRTEADRLQMGLKQNAMISAERQSMRVSAAGGVEAAKDKAYIRKLEKRLSQAGPPATPKKSGREREIPDGMVLVDSKELETLRRKNGKLEQSLAKAESDAAHTQRHEDELEAARKEIAALSAKVAEQDAEIQSMAEAMLAQGATEAEGEPDINNLDTSIFDNLNILCVGGHPSFLQGLQQLHPNIRCVGTKRPADSTILHADVVWLQTNCMSHDNFIPVVTLCRQYGVPLRFFKCAGHIPCRVQMVQETKAMLEAQLLSPATATKS